MRRFNAEEDKVAFQQGQVAFGKGAKIYDNPYKTGTAEHTWWANGWNRSHDEDYWNE